MGAMFASEKLYKTLGAKPLTGKEVKTTSKLETKIADTVADSVKNVKGRGKKKLLAIAADIALVGVSILTFDLGKKIGKKISGRDDEIKNVKTTSGLDYNS